MTRRPAVRSVDVAQNITTTHRAVPRATPGASLQHLRWVGELPVRAGLREGTVSALAREEPLGHMIGDDLEVLVLTSHMDFVRLRHQPSRFSHLVTHSQDIHAPTPDVHISTFSRVRRNAGPARLHFLGGASDGSDGWHQ